MKALLYKNINEIYFDEIQEPDFPSENWVKVEIKACGICGSDIQKILQSKAPESYLKTNVLGHEISGQIIEIGLNESFLKKGDRIAVEPIISCGYCDNCRSGKSQFCKNLIVIGRDICGGFTERILVPSKNVYKIPDNISYSEATQLDLIAVALHAIKRSEVSYENCICIIGDGTLGIILAQILQNLGVKDLIIFTKHNYKNKICSELGLQTAYFDGDLSVFNNKFNVVFECVGGKQNLTINEGINMTTYTGKIIVLGVYDFNYQPSINLRNAFYKEVSIIGINSYTKSYNHSDFKEALSLLEEQKININKLVTHQFNFNQIDNVLGLLPNKKDYIKIIFENI